MRADGGFGGRRGDFITSPEVGPLFGAVLARYLDAEWERIGRPDPFTVIDAGAGPGTLARTVLAARPACLDALTYVAVEVSPAQRERHPDGIESRPDLPAAPIDGVVIANELLDNLPFRLAVFDDGWREAFVDVDRAGRFVEVLSDVDSIRLRRGSRPAPIVGARAPLVERAAAFVDEARGLLRRRHAGLHRLRRAAHGRARDASVARVAAHVPVERTGRSLPRRARAARTSRSTSRSTSSPSRTRRGRRRSSSSDGGSPNSWPKACGCGPSRRPGPASRRCACAAGSPSPRRCSIPPASAPSSSPSGAARDRPQPAMSETAGTEGWSARSSHVESSAGGEARGRDLPSAAWLRNRPAGRRTTRSTR